MVYPKSYILFNKSEPKNFKKELIKAYEERNKSIEMTKNIQSKEDDDSLFELAIIAEKVSRNYSEPKASRKRRKSKSISLDEEEENEPTLEKQEVKFDEYQESKLMIRMEEQKLTVKTRVMKKLKLESTTENDSELVTVEQESLPTIKNENLYSTVENKKSKIEKKIEKLSPIVLPNSIKLGNEESIKSKISEDKTKTNKPSEQNLWLNTMVLLSPTAIFDLIEIDVSPIKVETTRCFSQTPETSYENPDLDEAITIVDITEKPRASFGPTNICTYHKDSRLERSDEEFRKIRDQLI